MHRLRLSDGRGQTIEFSAAAHYLSNQINDAYLSFCKNYRHSGVILEIFHGTHGWQPVYGADGYCKMIQNPLHLDYSGLKHDISHTLSVVDEWPTKQQRLAAEVIKRIRERDAIAQARRKNFHVIHCNTALI